MADPSAYHARGGRRGFQSKSDCTMGTIWLILCHFFVNPFVGVPALEEDLYPPGGAEVRPQHHPAEESTGEVH